MSINSSWIKRTNSAFPYFLLAVAAAGLGATWLLRRPDLTIYSLTIVIPLVMAALVLIFNHKTQFAGLELPATIGRHSFLNLLLINILILIVTVILLFSETTRSFIYFVLISIYAGLIIVQVLSERAKWTDNIILVEIILFSLNLAWGITLKYPLYFADTDTLGHMGLINSILQTGHTHSFIVDYIFYSVYHIYNAIGTEVTGLSLRSSLFVVMGLAWQVGVLFVYLLSRRLSKSTRFALITSILFASSSPIIFYASYGIARSLAFVLMVAWIYLIFGEARKDARYFTLSIIIMAAMIMTHHINILFVIPILFLVYILQFLFSDKNETSKLVSPLFIYLFSIACISYLFWVSAKLTNATLPETFRELTSMNFNLQSNPSEGYGFSVILGIIYYSFTMLLSFLGMRIVFEQLKSTGKAQMAGIFALSGFFLLVVFVPGPLDLLQLSSIVLTSRLQLMVAPFIVFVMATGIVYIVRIRENSRPSLTTALPSYILPAALVCVATLFSILGIGNDQDNNYLPNTRTIDTPYFTDSEIVSYSFINNLTDPSVELFADYQTIRNEYSITNVAVKNIIPGGDLGALPSSYLLLRIGELERKTALSFITSNGKVTYRYSINPADPKNNILLNLKPADRIFDDGYVEIFGLAGLSPAPAGTDSYD